MELPKVLESGRFLQDVPGRRRATFLGSVIHDRYARGNTINKRRTATLIPTMMGNDVDIDFPQLVHRTHELPFLVSGQIAQIQDSQLVERDQSAKGT